MFTFENTQIVQAGLRAMLLQLVAPWAEEIYLCLSRVFLRYDLYCACIELSATKPQKKEKQTDHFS